MMGTKHSQLSTCIMAIAAIFLSNCQPSISFSDGRASRPNEKPYEKMVFSDSISIGDLLSHEITYNFADNQTRHTLTLAGSNQTQTFQQPTRDVQTEMFSQGHNGLNQEESFSTLRDGDFDLLLIIDNSASMLPYQEKLARGFNELLSFIGNTNWTIAVATTDNSCLRETSDGYTTLNRDQYLANPEDTTARFEELVTIGSDGSTHELGIKNATEALLGFCDGISVPWTRTKSSKAVLILTDEINCGSAVNEGCEDEEYKYASFFTRRAPKGARVNGLLFFKDNEACEDSNNYPSPPPLEYLDLIRKTGGLSDEICQEEYGLFLRAISKHVVKEINTKFILKEEPVSNSTQVFMDGNPVDRGFTVSGNEITFDKDLIVNHNNILIKYQHSPTGIKQSFPLRFPGGTGHRVWIDGNLLETDQFTINSKGIFLLSPPADNASIKVSYFTSPPLAKSFPISNIDIEDNVSVYVDGTPTKFEIDYDKKILTLEPAPKEGAIISVELVENSNRTSFNISDFSHRKSSAISAFNSTTGDLIPITISEDGTSFDIGTEKVPLSEVTLVFTHFDDTNNKAFTIPLPHKPIKDSLTINEPNDKAHCRVTTTPLSTTIGVSCENLDRNQELNIRYQYLDYSKLFYKLKRQIPESASWTVTINGEKINDLFSWIFH